MSTYRLSMLNDGSWGNSGETDDEVDAWTAELATMLRDAFPGVEVEIVSESVSRQPDMDEDLAHEIQGWINDHYGEAIDRVEARKP